MNIKNNVKDFFLYLIVGGIATVSEWVLFFIFDKIAVHYMIATAIAYLLSTYVNWVAGRFLVFKEGRGSVVKELIEIYIASIIGLLLNLIIMWVAVKTLSVNEMLSKMAATGIVFFYNFLIRKLIIYKKK